MHALPNYLHGLSPRFLQVFVQMSPFQWGIPFLNCTLTTTWHITHLFCIDLQSSYGSSSPHRGTENPGHNLTEDGGVGGVGLVTKPDCKNNVQTNVLPTDGLGHSKVATNQCSAIPDFTQNQFTRYRPKFFATCHTGLTLVVVMYHW